MTILIINSEEIWCAGLGDCKAVVSTVQGRGPQQINFIDLTKEHKARLKDGHLDERKRIQAAGYTIA